MTLDPRKAECKGLYLFGSGYFAHEDEAKARLLSRRASFCAECPVRGACEEEHIYRVRHRSPREVARFERQVREAQKRGATPAQVSATLAKIGRPEPFMALALQNYQDGIAEAGRLFDKSAG